MQINSDGVYRYAASEWFNRALAALACSGVRGVAIDVWVSADRLATAHNPMLDAAVQLRG